MWQLFFKKSTPIQKSSINFSFNVLLVSDLKSIRRHRGPPLDYIHFFAAGVLHCLRGKPKYLIRQIVHYSVFTLMCIEGKPYKFTQRTYQDEWMLSFQDFRQFCFINKPYVSAYTRARSVNLRYNFVIIFSPCFNENVKIFPLVQQCWETAPGVFIHRKKKECLQCSQCTKPGVSQRTSAVKGYLILRKDANMLVFTLFTWEWGRGF